MSRHQQTHVLLAIAGLVLTLTSAHFPNLRPQVITSSGTLRGLRVNKAGVMQFLGVPYAMPPVGKLRFRPPQELTVNYDHYVDASQYRSHCIQPKHMAELIYPQLLRHHTSDEGSEDCLFLNLFVPNKKENNMPVMVWIPGEGYSFAISNHFDGSHIARQGSVIVVTLNYRVGPMGFLSTGDDHVSGNMGLMDQLAAIRWVKNNIIAFGGDPTRITVFGRLSGAMSVSALLASPKSMEDGKPIFQRAIMQSGVAGDAWTIDHDPMTGAMNLAQKVGCPKAPTEDMVSCLRSVSADKINEVALFTHSWRPVLNDAFLPDEPLHIIKAGKHLPIPVMVGSTNDEGSLCLMTHHFLKTPYNAKIHANTLTEGDFDELLEESITSHYGSSLPNITSAARKAYKKFAGSWRQKYLWVCGDLFTQSKTLTLSRLLSSHGSRVFLYEFSHRPTQSFYPEFVRAAHGDDILFTFGFVNDADDNKTKETERQLSDTMISAWTNFAKKGNPNPMLHTSHEWLPFSTNRKEFWEFQSTDIKAQKTKSHSMDDWAVELWSRASQDVRQQRLKTH